MLSIENSYDEADLRKFDADVRKALGPARPSSTSPS
jgi:DNA ligase (NAD+)